MRLATQGIADFLKAERRKKTSPLAQRKPTLVLGHDARFLGRDFSLAVAEVLEANGFTALLCDRDTPTPVISHTIRVRKALGGINMTASHNPAEYQGLKYSLHNGAPASLEVTRKIEAHIAKRQTKNWQFQGSVIGTYTCKKIDPMPAYFKRIRQLVDFKAIQRGGAYSGYGVVTILYAGGLMFGVYDLPAVRYRGLRVLTNTPPPGAMRGHGITDVRYAFESLLDKIANKLGIDAIEIRRRNLLKAPKYETLNEMFINSYGLPECLDWVEEKSGWKDRKGKLGPNRGLGVACAHYPSGASKPVNWTGEPHATVHLKLDWDGSITLLTGAPEIGQGSTTMATQCAAETLGLDMKRFQSLTSDSKLTPKDNGSYSSRVTYMVGNASIDAATNLKNILIEAAARKLEVKPEDIECLGEVYRAGTQDEGLTFNEVVQAALEGTGTITVKGNFDTLPESWGTKKYRGGAISGSMAYAYAAQVVEVSIDPITAEITVEKVWAAQDVGKALNPLAVEGQIEGSVWMGMGQAISEGIQYVNGLGITNSMLDYRVPTIVESPPIEVGIIESIDPHGPFGAKEAGETSLVAFIPALTNAIADAIGVRPIDLPVTPDRLLQLMEDYQNKQRNAK